MLPEDNSGAEITSGAMDVTDVKDDIGAEGAIIGTHVGIDRLGMLPMPRRRVT